MYLIKEVLEDFSEYGRKRLETYIKIKDYQDRHSTDPELSEIESIIDTNFKETKTYSLGRFLFQLNSLKKDLESSSVKNKIMDFINWLDTVVEQTSKITLDKTNIKDNPNLVVVSAINTDGIFNTELKLKDSPVSISVSENTDGSKDAMITAVDDTTGNRTEFSLEDNGNLYDTIVQRVNLELKRMSVSERYTRGKIVKDLNNTHFKVVGAGDPKFYKIQDCFGKKTFVEKEGFEAVTMKTRKKKYIPGLPSAFSEANVGSVVKTADGKEKVIKQDKDDVWVEFGTDTTIKGVKYPKGTSVAYKDKAVVKEEIEETKYSISIDKDYKIPKEEYLFRKM